MYKICTMKWDGHLYIEKEYPAYIAYRGEMYRCTNTQRSTDALTKLATRIKGITDNKQNKGLVQCAVQIIRWS